jgi:hypothetical protein
MKGWSAMLTSLAQTNIRLGILQPKPKQDQTWPSADAILMAMKVDRQREIVHERFVAMYRQALEASC